jgi:hypothetical protein
MTKKPELHAVIGAWNRGKKTYHVKRSQTMTNYPGVWSLFSIQFDPTDMPDPSDLTKVQTYMETMSAERLNSVELQTIELLASDSSDKNSIGYNVHLHLYRVELDHEPRLNSKFYEDGRWMTFEEYEQRARDAPCGLCMRMWGDLAYMYGIIDHPFIPGRR